jgi:hypothetical protein
MRLCVELIIFARKERKGAKAPRKIFASCFSNAALRGTKNIHAKEKRSKEQRRYLHLISLVRLCVELIIFARKERTWQRSGRKIFASCFSYAGFTCNQVVGTKQESFFFIGLL